MFSLNRDATSGVIRSIKYCRQKAIPSQRAVARSYSAAQRWKRGTAEAGPSFSILECPRQRRADPAAIGNVYDSYAGAAPMQTSRKDRCRPSAFCGAVVAPAARTCELRRCRAVSGTGRRPWRLRSEVSGRWRPGVFRLSPGARGRRRARRARKAGLLAAVDARSSCRNSLRSDRRGNGAKAGSLMLRLQVVPAAKPGRDDFRSYSRVRRLISGCDLNLPADFRI